MMINNFVIQLAGACKGKYGKMTVFCTLVIHYWSIYIKCAMINLNYSVYQDILMASTILTHNFPMSDERWSHNLEAKMNSKVYYVARIWCRFHGAHPDVFLNTRVIVIY